MEEKRSAHFLMDFSLENIWNCRRNFTLRQRITQSGMMQQKGGESMNITDVRIRKINIEGKMKAVVSVTFDNSFVVHDVKVVEGQNGLFVAMPSRKTPEGEFRDIAHPISADAREYIQTAVLKAYQEAI